MGEIELVVPITNIAIFKTVATNLSKVLGISTKNLENLIYYRSYIVIDKGTTNILKDKQILEKRDDYFDLMTELLDEVINEEGTSKSAKNEANSLKKDLELAGVFIEDYFQFLKVHKKIRIITGSEAFLELLKKVDVDEELNKIEESEKTATKDSAKKINDSKKRFLKAFKKTGMKLEWMVMKNLPVIACGLRPVTKLKDDETITTTQINNLYRKILMIDSRLSNHLLKEKLFFDEIIHDEMRRLQMAVDQLVYGSPSKQQTEVKSLLQSLSGKEGILRRYSLGKRVDYSARSVIVPDPTLSLDQVGIPVKIALVLYKQFIISELLKEKIAFTVKESENIIMEEQPIIFSILNKVVKDRPVLLNRAPSLHRLSMQGFYPKLVLGKSVRLHPLITTAANADFDGDQMAVHLAITEKSRKEIKDTILSIHHTIDSKNGHLITIPTQDMILGLYYLTREEKKRENVDYYDNLNNLSTSYERGKISLHETIVVPATLVKRNLSSKNNEFIFTTLGKIIFNNILPSSFNFYINNLKEYNRSENYEIDSFTFDKIEENYKERDSYIGG
jgi:DNA-directed RNA polymerase subunit beta'